MNTIPHDLESCVTNFSILGFHLNILPNTMPR